MMNMKNQYEVSVPLFVCPFVKVDAENEKDAKAKAYEIMESTIKKDFKKVDVRVLNQDGWRVDRIPTEMEKALEYLKEYTEIDTDLLKDAYVCESTILNGHNFEMVYLDFDEECYGANLCYLRIDGENIYLNDESKGYPMDIADARTYVWTDGRESFYFDEKYKRVYFNSSWSTCNLYERLKKLNAILDHQGVILISYDKEEVVVRTYEDYEEDTRYVFKYKSYSDTYPISGEMIHTLSL